MLRKIATTTLILALAASVHADEPKPAHPHHGGFLEAADADHDGNFPERNSSPGAKNSLLDWIAMAMALLTLPITATLMSNMKL